MCALPTLRPHPSALPTLQSTVSSGESLSPPRRHHVLTSRPKALNRNNNKKWGSNGIIPTKYLTQHLPHSSISRNGSGLHHARPRDICKASNSSCYGNENIKILVFFLLVVCFLIVGHNTCPWAPCFRILEGRSQYSLLLDPENKWEQPSLSS